MKSAQVYPDSDHCLYSQSMSVRVLSTPKNEQFILKEQIVSCKFRKKARLVMILIQFLSSLQEEGQLQKERNRQLFKKRSILPLYPDDRVCLIWDFVSAILNFIAVILYPLNISFEDPETIDLSVNIYQNKENTITWMTLIIDISLMGDIIVNLLTCQIDTNNYLVTDWVGLWKQYLKGWLLFDFVSVIPYRLISSMPFLSLLKLWRVIKYFFQRKRQYFVILDTIHNSHEPQIQFFDPQTMVILNMLKNMFLLVNLFGCLWNYLIEYDTEILNTSLSAYITSVYWAMQTVTVVGYGDIISTTPLEYLLTNVWLLIGVGFYSFTIGNLAAVFDQQQTSQDYDHDLEALESLFQKVIVPDTIQNYIMNFICYNVENNIYWMYDHILEPIPINLRKSIISITANTVIKNIPFFMIDLNYSTWILPQFNVMFMEQYQQVYSIGSPANEVYFLVTGEVRLINQNGETVLNIHEGFIFGELERDCERSLQAVASAQSILLVCRSEVFFESLKHQSDLTYELEQLTMRRQILIKQAKKPKKARIKRMASITEFAQGRMSVQDYLLNKQQLEAQFKHKINTTSYSAQQQELLIVISDKQSERRRRLKQLFRETFYKIIESIKRRPTQPQSRRNRQSIKVRMCLNFDNIVREERKIQKKLINTRFTTLKNIMTGAKLTLQQSKLASEIRIESCLEKKMKTNYQCLQQNKLQQLELASRKLLIESAHNRILNWVQNLSTEIHNYESELSEANYEIDTLQEIILNL